MMQQIPAENWTVEAADGQRVSVGRCYDAYCTPQMEKVNWPRSLRERGSTVAKHYRTSMQWSRGDPADWPFSMRRTMAGPR